MFAAPAESVEERIMESVGKASPGGVASILLPKERRNRSVFVVLSPRRTSPPSSASSVATSTDNTRKVRFTRHVTHRETESQLLTPTPVASAERLVTPPVSKPSAPSSRPHRGPPRDSCHQRPQQRRTDWHASGPPVVSSSTWRSVRVDDARPSGGSI